MCECEQVCSVILNENDWIEIKTNIYQLFKCVVLLLSPIFINVCIIYLLDYLASELQRIDVSVRSFLQQ